MTIFSYTYLITTRALCLAKKVWQRIDKFAKFLGYFAIEWVRCGIEEKLSTNFNQFKLGKKIYERNMVVNLFSRFDNQRKRLLWRKFVVMYMYLALRKFYMASVILIRPFCAMLNILFQLKET